MTYGETDPFFGETDEKEEQEPDTQPTDTLEASPEDVVDQQIPAYPPDMVSEDGEID